MSSTPQSGTVITYTYDAAGNRLSRTVTVPTPAEIVIEDSSTAPPTDLADGSATLSFSATAVGQSASRTLTIRNTGQAPLTGLVASITGAQSADFSATGLPASLAGGASASVTLTFSPAAPGTRGAALHIASNDADENPFDIALIGIGSPPTESVTFTEGPHPPFATNAPITVSSYATGGKALGITLTFAPRTGTILTVVRNTGTAPIAGTFYQLPQGGTLNLLRNGKTYPFVINYFGGNGNDIELVWADTDLVAWGANASSQLGDGTAVNALSPVVVGTGSAPPQATWISTAVGESHSLALSADGRVFSWGLNDVGQLGDGTTTSRAAPVQVIATGALAGKMVVALAAGRKHSLALCSDGTAYAWGWNAIGQLGDASNTDRSAPVAVDVSGALAGKSLIAVSAGALHSLALTSEGKVVAWGSNAFGRLGNGTTTSTNAPVSIAASGALAGKTVVSVSAGGEHSLAVCDDGAVAAWGRNLNGRLGDGSVLTRTSPVILTTWGSPVAEVSAGGAHSIAMNTDGNEMAWGLNSSGQVGSSSAASEILTPAPVMLNLAQYNRAVFAGASHSLSLVSFDGSQNKQGRVWTWGGNASGQLGTGNSSSSTTPVYLDHAGALAQRPVMSLARGSSANHALAVAANPLTAPEIAVFNTTGVPEIELQSGGSLDFGTMQTGTFVTRTLAVRNAGDGDLSGLAVTIFGAAVADYTVSPPPATIAPGGSATLTVQFSTATTGSRTATIRIASNDANENPFDITLTGIGGTPSEVWRYQYFGSAANTLDGADLAQPKDDGIPNLLKYALVLDPTKVANADLPKAALIEDASGKRLSVSFHRDPARSDIKIEVEAASSPTGPWEVIAISMNGAMTTGAGAVIETDEPGGNKSVRVSDTVTTSQSDHRFMRVRVTR